MNKNKWTAEEILSLRMHVDALGFNKGIKSFMEVYPNRSYKACAAKYRRDLDNNIEFIIQDTRDGDIIVNGEDVSREVINKKNTPIFKKIINWFKNLFS